MLLSALQSIDVSPDVPDTARSPEGARAALLYRAGHWDRAHEMVQDLETAAGSFWHGIFHRHEGEWSNARYWFQRVGQHPVYPSIYNSASAIITRNPELHWQQGPDWDPILFVQWCKQAAARPGTVEESAAVEIQVAEWRHLFAWCIA